MLRGIDHLVILVQDLAAAAADYAAVGFTVTPGGEHAGGMTHNALIGFADGGYLELIAFHAPEREQPHRWWPRLAKGAGVVDYALLADDLVAEAAALRGRGVDTSDPAAGGRHRPDGQRIGWRNLYLTPSPTRMGLPFLIADMTPRELRVPGGAAAAHPLGVMGVAGLTLVVADLAAAGRRLGAVLDDPGAATPAGDDGDGRRFPVGDQWLHLIQPAAATTTTGRHLHAFGDSPYELILTTGAAVDPGEGALVPSEQTHGARIRVAA